MKNTALKTLLTLIAIATITTTTFAQQIAGGLEHSIFLCSDSTVKTVGGNSYGQLGHGENIDKKLPESVAINGIIAVSAGLLHSLFLKSDGTVWTCGDNESGQLGDGSNTNKNTPVQVSGLSNITAIATGDRHSLFLKNDGTVWVCGNNYYGQLGDGTYYDRNTPVQVTSLNNISGIAAGIDHSLFLKNDGTVWATGLNFYGQLGDGSKTDKITPVKVNSLSGITAISANKDHSLFLKNDGTVWGCGDNYNGQLGDGTNSNKHTPVQVSGLSNISAIATGYSHSLFLKNDGTVWVCGGNSYGQLGNGTNSNKNIPVQASGLNNIPAIAAGHVYSLFLKNDGTVWVCGGNRKGQLGDGSNINKNILVSIGDVCVPPAPPTIDYSNFPGSLCLGSQLNETPVISGSNPTLTLVTDNSIAVTAPKKIAANSQFVFVLNGNDEILRYDNTGTLQFTYNPSASFISDVKAFAVNDSNEVFAYAGTGNDDVHKFDALGNYSTFESVSLGGGNGITDMKFAPIEDTLNYPWNLFVFEKGAGAITGIDVTDNNSFTNSAPFFYDLATVTSNITSMTFDKKLYKENRLIAADPNNHKLFSAQIYDPNVTPVEELFVDSFSTAGMALDYVYADTTYDIVLATSQTTGTMAFIQLFSEPDGTHGAYLDTSLLSSVNVQTPVGAVTIKQGNFPQIWVADAAQNNITRISMQMISVTPDLPAGLRFNPFTGRVDGTAKATAPSTTYTAIVYSDLGNDTTTFTFEVTSTANISNSTGSSTTSSNHKDGLTVKYFNPSNCEKLIEVVDSVGGTSPGNTEVTQEIFPIISVFAGDSLVRRVTEIIAENPEADATIKLFYSYQDIDLYNQSVGNPLSNDTAGGTMQVAALQLHKRPNGSIEVIKHSPITANWVSKDQNWVAEYTITKFSSFYLGDSNTINAFDCSSSGSTSVTACGSYTSPSGRHTWTTSGTYIDTIANTTSCDSVLTINLTVNPAVDISVTQTGVTLTANATNATYQWLDCDNGFAVITGETNQSFTPTTDGNYAVAITKNGCTVNSACYNVITSGILSLSSEDELIGNIYPNPNSGTFTLSLNKSLQNGKVEVLNSVGQVIYTNNSSAKQQFIELNDAEQGFYFIKITSNDYQAVKRMIVNK